MKLTARIFLLLSIIALMAGCKLAVIVVEGGEVLSTGSGTCVVGSICIVDVTDPNFSESFTAVPEEGWYFHRWNLGYGFFCGGSTDPTCTLSFQGYEESEGVENMVASSELFYLMPVFGENSNIVEVDGKEWLQPLLFLNLSWNDIDAICPNLTGICDGVLNGYNLTGWTWASIDDANTLFNYYIGYNAMGPGPDIFFDSPGSTWANAFFSDGWLATTGYDGVERLTVGWLRGLDIINPDVSLGVEGVMGKDADLEGSTIDGASTRGSRRTMKRGAFGGWFYRTL